MIQYPTLESGQACDPEMRAALHAFSVGDYESYCRWLTKQSAQRGLRGAEGSDQYAPPDPYAIARPIEADPDLDPRHRADPSVPADGYSIALAVEQFKRDVAAGVSIVDTYDRAKQREIPLDENGVPDSYVNGIAEMRRKEQR